MRPFQAAIADLEAKYAALTAEIAAVKTTEGPPGRDGRDGHPGPAGKPGEKGADGKDGRDGFSPDHLELAYDGETGELVMFMRAFDRMVERRLPLPMLRDAGLWRANKRYRQGHVVTYGGSAFVAVRDTSAPLGGRPPSPDWRLLVQRGRDA